MKFGGWQKTSFIDFPGKISAVLFTQGCTFRCPFCHNPSLVLPKSFSPSLITEQEVLSFLEERKGKLDGVVISGGEPTIHPDLPEMIRAIKKLGFAVKVDTNGSCPAMVEQLLSEKTVDYWAIDRKASLSRYPLLTGVDFDPSLVEKTSQMIRTSTVAYEFRTTVIRELHPPEELELIGKELAGAKLLVLQQFRPQVTLDPQMQHKTAYTDEEMESLCSLIKPYVRTVLWR